MKKVLQIVDIYSWAIGTLAKSVVKVNDHLDWKCIAVHPKDLEQGKVDLDSIRELVKWADVIDAEYWRTISQLIEFIPELKEKPIFLWHHNEKNLFSYDWPANVIHVTTTKYAEAAVKERYPLSKVFYVANSYNPDEFHFNPDYPPKEKMVGYVGRIVPWKGLKELCQACFELGYPLMLMGKMDKPSYYDEIPEEHKSVIRWDYFNCDDKDRANFYKEITCYVGNSGSGRETGPLGLIEAMASGVPCVSTSAGIAADIGEDGENMLLVDYDDVDGLKEAIQRVMETPALQARLRKNGWDTIKGYNHERRGMATRKMYNEILFKGELVSVIVPTTPDKLDQTHQLLEALGKSTYLDIGIEAVVVFDQASKPMDEASSLGSYDPDTSKLVDAFKAECRTKYPFPVKVLATGLTGGYNLAVARNMGVIEADGKYLMFCDNRMKPEPDAIEQFLAVIKETPGKKVWLFGEKGGEKTTFVENFSMILRQQFIDAGMCNERITAYGGMSQELRTRFSRQGFEFGYVKMARAEQLCKSSLSLQKRDGIISMKNLLSKLGL